MTLMRLRYPLVLVLAGAALWVLARDASTDGAPRGPVREAPPTHAAAAPERGDPAAPVSSAPAAPAGDEAVAGDEDDGRDRSVADLEDARRRHWGEDDPERRLTWDELEVEHAARPLSARIRAWR